MFTFQSIMFVSLGFLCALLLGFVVAPAYWARAVRLTTERMRASVPLTEREISAERDRLRAENAIRVHRLTAKIEQARLYDARQKVEINRRDGTINALQRRLEQIEAEREGGENARRVLEATITKRVPEVEGRLIEARQLLAKRDAEMQALQSDTSRTFRALDDAMQVNAQQRAEIDRLKMSLAGRGVRLPGPAPAVAETDTALRAELEKLRVRAREQAALIARLQNARGGVQKGAVAKDDVEPVIGFADALGDEAGVEAADAGGRPAGKRRAEAEWFKAKIEEQSRIIEGLRGQIEIYEEAAQKQGRSLSLRDSKAALKSRVAAVEKEIALRDKTIAGLRRELATANERIARQASYYQDEFRRLGSRPATSAGQGNARRIDGDAGLVAVASAVDAGETAPASEPPPLPDFVEPAAAVARASVDEAAGSRAAGQKAPGLQSRLVAAGADETEQKLADVDDRLVAVSEGPAGATGPAKSEPRGKLMDRIAGLAKP